MEYLDYGGGVSARGSFLIANNQGMPVGVMMPSILKVTDQSVGTTAAVIISAANVAANVNRIVITNIHATIPAYLNNTTPEDTSNGLRLNPGESWHCRPSNVPYGIATAATSVKIVQLG